MSPFLQRRAKLRDDASMLADMESALHVPEVRRSVRPWPLWYRRARAMRGDWPARSRIAYRRAAMLAPRLPRKPLLYGLP